MLDGRGDKANSGILNDNLAVLMMHQGRFDEAERYHKRAMALLEQALGRNHPSVGTAAANLGTTMNEAGRSIEAEPLLRRALDIKNAQKPFDAVATAVIEDNLAGLLRATDRHTEALDHFKRALELFRGALPAQHPRLATARNNFGRYLLDIGRYPAAEAELKQSLAIVEAIYGRDNFNVAVPLVNLADVYASTGRRDDARATFARAIALLEATYGAKHFSLLPAVMSSARLELRDGNVAAATALFQRGVDIELAHRARLGGKGGPSTGNAATRREPFLGLIDALWKASDDPATRDAGRALEIAQWDGMNASATAIAALGARAAANDPALAGLVRERQDLAAQWQAADRQITDLLAQSSQRNEETERELRSRIAALDSRIAEIDGSLATSYPAYRDLAAPAALTLAQVRDVLRPSEAVIQIMSAPDATDVWAVTRDGIVWHRAPIASTELQRLVRALRCGLDAAAWTGGGTQRCAVALGLDPSVTVAPKDVLPFDVARAHRLYEQLLAPLRNAIDGKDLLVVGSGALTSLPLQVLVTEAPSPTAAIDDYANVAWLGRKHAVTVLPSLSSLGALRRLARPSEAKRPYLGFGNPLLSGTDGTDRRAFEVAACDPATPAPLAVASSALAAAPLLRTTSIDELRRQPPLPETADELCRVARFTRAAADDVLTGARATEAAVKSLSQSGRLADARVLHFATHGLLAGETALFNAARTEPSLLLTPPAQASDTDDGLLTASEVAALKLDADWVILSACNTASGDDVGAEQLSGLARAFFYAGARALLVSHWAVNSDATVKLVTSAFETLSRDPSAGPARALAAAMAAMIGSGGRNAHPAYWSPFVVVGGSLPVVAAKADADPATAAPPAKRRAAGRPSQRAPARAPIDAEPDWKAKVLGR